MFLLSGNASLWKKIGGSTKGSGWVLQQVQKGVELFMRNQSRSWTPGAKENGRLCDW